ncbi:MAG: FAD-binding protein [Nitrospinota bacterium]|nr:FAD-binding protein [Nitrospinota bacterium]
MARLESLGKVHNADVLIVGGGLAGLWAAIRALQCRPDLSVLVVDAAYIGKSGHAYFAQGQLVTWLPEEDDLDEWVEDVARGNEWLCPQDMVEDCLKNSLARIEDHERFGIRYHRRKGTYWRQLCRGLTKVKLIHSPRIGGQGMMLALRGEALRLGARLMSHVTALDLLRDSRGAAAGAVGMGIRDGVFHVFRAKSTVLCTNTFSFRSYFVYDQPGSGPVMAYKAGARVRNAEFHLLRPASPKFYFEGQGTAATYGARFLDARRRTFMERYDPVLGDRSDFPALVRAMVIEKQKGNGTFYFDTTTIPPGDRGLWSGESWQGYMDLAVRKLKDMGIDLFKDPQEYVPMYTVSKIGIRSDIRCATDVPALFTAGFAQAFNLEIFNGWSIASTVWSGHRAGESAAAYAAGRRMPRQSHARVRDLKRLAYEGLERKKGGGLDPDAVVLKLQKILFPYDVFFIRKADRLERALAAVLDLQAEAGREMFAPDIHELVRFNDTRQMLIAAEMSLRASLLRTESRSSCFREDHAHRDDRSWLKWIDLREGGGRMELTTEPVPFEGYKFRPPDLARTAV